MSESFPVLADQGRPLFGPMLAQIRRDARWRQGDLAQAIGCTRAFISRLEHGEKPPSPRLLDEIIGALCINQEQSAALKDAAELDRGVFVIPADMPASVRRDVLRFLRGNQDSSLGSWKTLARELSAR